MAHQDHHPPARERSGEASAVAPVHAHGPAGAHGSADDEYAVTPPGAGHEHTDASVWIIVKFGLWLAVSAIVIHVGLWLVFELMVQAREGTTAEFPLAQGQEERLPDGPRLQPIPVNDVYRFRMQEDTVLQNYRWIDREGGRVQIPIADAMRLTVERGLPVRAQQPEPAEPVAPGLLPADSSSGRTMERRRQ